MTDSAEYFNLLSQVSGVNWTRWQGPGEIQRVARERQHALIAYARAHSPFYRRHYREAGPDDGPLEAFPIVDKRLLMANFDEWVTDPAVTRQGVLDFVADPARIGERFLSRYAVWKSSGTTGEPGLFVQDAAALATYNALLAAQLQRPAVAAAYGFGMLAHGGRAALVVATGEHFASIVAWRRLARGSGRVATCELSVMRPLSEWVAELNRFQPAFVAGYATVLQVLAAEQAEGRLAITPTILWSGGEQLSDRARRAIEGSFRCLVIDEYGSSECLSIGFGCDRGWLHVNADWVVVEAVDRDHRPVPQGTLSTTALLTNFANRVQPVIRYDLGDRILLRPDPCECGNPLPAMKVHGRCDDVLILHRPDGTRVALLPMALTTAVEETAGLHTFQIVQRGAAALALRLPHDEPRRRESAFLAARAALAELLAAHALTEVDIALDAEAPRKDPVSGKLHQVIAQPAVTHASHAHAHPDSPLA